MGYQVDKSAPKVINRDFSKNEFFLILPIVRAACAAKSTSVIIFGYPQSADQAVSKSELAHVQGCFMKSWVLDMRS